jgi:hypothetical protein
VRRTLGHRLARAESFSISSSRSSRIAANSI